ncbi:class I SAM-dependent DNA methyltransferase [Streptomyces sp. AK02-01A]|uniref:class I SAM-dependent DNA methyltransferase n=1 Tax=Streptomyces sp. AK02-01A TaxID=3028648 RepID=UPI0029B8CE00|nr:methyltransferase domain-containing protein [Streptomyces sp. AK02-01A]MDX3852391.1 methyltransferase domain-containing protein [Streptomyces sp. AK02-01A]
MKGQPCPPEGFPDLYDAIADAYDRLDDWIVSEWGEKPRPERADFLQKYWASRFPAVRNVLEICCGTGLMLEQLALRGFEVSGLDRSAAMLGHARERLGPEVPLVLAELPSIPVSRQFDAVISSGAALNYMSGEDDLAATFRSVAGVLRPGGSFVFDILGRAMMDGHAGSDVWAADLGDLAFIWEFENAPSGDYCDATYTQFLHREGNPADSYEKTIELHRLYVLDPELIRRVARDSGFIDTAVHDNYTDGPAHDATLYETWTFTRA